MILELRGLATSRARTSAGFLLGFRNVLWFRTALNVMDRSQGTFPKNSATKKSETLTSCGPIAILVQYPDRVGLALRG